MIGSAGGDGRESWNVLVPTGTSAFSEPAAFVTAALYVSPNGEYAIVWETH